MAVQGFGFTLKSGRQVTAEDPEFREKMPISSAMIEGLKGDVDISNVVSQLATAIVKLEAAGVEFDDEAI